MNLTYKPSTKDGGTDYFYITCRKYSAGTRGDKAVKQLADYLSTRLMKADELQRFEKYIKEEIELANAMYPSKYELKVDIHSTAVDGNGQYCRECEIYRYDGSGATLVCCIYLHMTGSRLSFTLENPKKEQPLFQKEGGKA